MERATYILLIFYRFNRWKALYLYVGGLHVEVCQVGRIDPALPQTHGSKAIQMSALSKVVLSLGPPFVAHEETLTMTKGLAIKRRKKIIFNIFKKGKMILNIFSLLFYFNAFGKCPLCTLYLEVFKTALSYFRLVFIWMLVNCFWSLFDGYQLHMLNASWRLPITYPERFVKNLY